MLIYYSFSDHSLKENFKNGRKSQKESKLSNFGIYYYYFNFEGGALVRRMEGRLCHGTMAQWPVQDPRLHASVVHTVHNWCCWSAHQS